MRYEEPELQKLKKGAVAVLGEGDRVLHINERL